VTRLFAEVYLDEDVSVLVASLLRARGFKAVTTRDSGHLGQTDSAQLDYAATREMLFVTHNRVDFEVLHGQWLAANKVHWGIVIASRRPPNALVANILRLLSRITADEFRSQLLYL